MSRQIEAPLINCIVIVVTTKDFPLCARFACLSGGLFCCLPDVRFMFSPRFVCAAENMKTAKKEKRIEWERERERDRKKLVICCLVAAN